MVVKVPAQQKTITGKHSCMGCCLLEQSRSPTMSPCEFIPCAAEELAPGKSIMLTAPLLSRKPWELPLLSM